MIAFHLIMSAYGFWLPNDPRGSWSDFVAAFELLKYGPATKVHDPRSHAKDIHNSLLRRSAKQSLKYPPVRFVKAQRHAIAAGFAQACTEGQYHCFACCISFDHIHGVFAAHPRQIPIIAGHLKAAATRVLTSGNIHPLADFNGKRGTSPTPWSEGCWKVYIDKPDQLNAAIRYVQKHLAKENLPPQSWPFVQTVDPSTLVSQRATR